MATQYLESPHLDYKVLGALEEVMEQDYPLLLDTFLSDSSARVDELHRARDAQQLGNAAHSFKGSSSNMGATQLAELCRQLEDRARQKPLTGIEDLVHRIDAEFGIIQRLYQAERDRFPG